RLPQRACLESSQPVDHAVVADAVAARPGVCSCLSLIRRDLRRCGIFPPARNKQRRRWFLFAGKVGLLAMQFSTARPDVVRAINQRWLLTFWNRHRGDHAVPRWQVIEAENISRMADSLSFLDVIRGEPEL